MGDDGHKQDVMRAVRTGPFEVALKAAVRGSGLSPDRLAARGLRVSTSTLSNWQTGRSRPERPESLRAVRVLEELIGLPGDSLVQLLGPKRPRGRWQRHVPGAVDYGALITDVSRATTSG